MGHTPGTAGTFRKKFRENIRKDPGNALRAFLEFASRVRLGSPNPYNSRHLKPPEHFQNSLPPSTAGDASFFRSASGEGLSESVMEFPAVLGAFLSKVHSFLGVIAFLQHAPERSSASKIEAFLQNPGKWPKSSADKMEGACMLKDQTLKILKTRTLLFPDGQRLRGGGAKRIA